MKRALFFSLLLVVSSASAELTITREGSKIFLNGTSTEVRAELAQLSPSTRVSGTKVEITHLLNQKVRDLDGKHWLDGSGGFGNCHGQAAYFAGLAPILMHDESSVLVDTAARSAREFEGFDVCREIEYSQVRAGDIGRIISVGEDGRNTHSFSVLSKNLVFSKNGHNGLRIPYRVQTLTAIADTYFSVLKNEENPSEGVINLHRESLRQGVDCVRGPMSQKRGECIDNEGFIVFFSRCKSIAQIERENRADLSAEYFALKNLMFNELNTFVATQRAVLVPRPLSRDFNAAADRAQQESARLNEAGKKGAAYLWNQLYLYKIVADDFLTGNSVIRRAIFPAGWQSRSN